MFKKHIYLFQTSIRYENTLYLPYTAGVLAAFAWSNEVVAENYELKGIIHMRDCIEKTANALDSPYLAAFSNYIWNFEYNKALARQIKKIYPECIVVFGGHNVPFGNALIDENPFIDILVHGEGEEAFRDILLASHNGEPFSAIANISYRDKRGQSVETPAVPVSCVDFPSPYQAGLFDSMLDEHPDTRFSAVLETNRGCPYSCAFCDWCLLDTKVRRMPAERVYGDLEWMSAHNIEFCYCADANFGILPEDEQYINRLIELNKRNCYPKKFRVNYSKHNNDTVFRINKSLNAYGISKGATLSFQSLNPKVLDNIGRKNIPLDKFAELMTLYSGAGIPTYSELILGLPGETYDSFCDGVSQLLEAGQHSSILIYNCELIVNSKMANKDYMEKHGIQAALTPLYLRHDEPKYDEIPEFSRSVTATATMDSAAWIRANLFSVTVQSCHGMGLLRCFALYLYYEEHILYRDFYQSLVDWALQHPSGALGSEMLSLRGEFDKITKGTGSWSCVKAEFGNVSWPYEEALYLALVYRLDVFYEEISEFLERYAIPGDIFDCLMRYQRSIVKTPGKRSFSICVGYDLPAYFSQILVQSHPELHKQQVEVSAQDDSLPERWDDFAKQCVWFGRKEQGNLFTQLTVKPFPAH